MGLSRWRRCGRLGIRVGCKGPAQKRTLRGRTVASLVELLSASSQEVYAACGFNGALWGGSSSAAVREAWRLALFGILSPLGKLVEAELRAKLDEDIPLSWRELRASDLSGRARAMQSMVNGGMAVTDAVSVAGLMVQED